MCDVAIRTWETISTMDCADRVCHNITIHPETVSIMVTTTLLALYYPLGHILMMRGAKRQVDWSYTLSCRERNDTSATGVLNNDTQIDCCSTANCKAPESGLQDYTYRYNDTQLACLLKQFRKKTETMSRFYEQSGTNDGMGAANNEFQGLTPFAVVELMRLMFFVLLVGVCVWSLCVITPAYVEYLRNRGNFGE